MVLSQVFFDKFSNNFYLVRTDGGGEKLDNGLEGPEMFKEYYTIDSDGDGTDEEYPVYKNYEAQRIPKTRDPMIINPLPGCFGYGPGPVKVKGPRLTLNTSSFVTYAQVKHTKVVLLHINERCMSCR